jgi:histidinol-phosphate/aromatic aminotransferase/cobyric acid decarboxylase-like protein
MSDWLLEEFKSLQLDFKDLTYGDALTGSQRIFRNLSKLFQNYFHPLTPVTNKHMVAGVGVSAVLDQLCDKICDAGDSILIAAPYYSEYPILFRHPQLMPIIL